MVSPYAKVRINNDELDLIAFDFLKECNCLSCISGRELGAKFLTYRIGETCFYIDWMPGTISFWDGCPNSVGAVPVLFEEVFEEVPDDIREVFIYHLNIFSH